jgi:hypothetical protein
MDSLVPKMRLRLEGSPQDREQLRLTPPPTRGWPRNQPLVRQSPDSKPPTWGQIKKLMAMATMVNSSLGIAGNPAATLLMAFVIITTQLSVAQGDTHWTFMPNSPSCHLVEPPCIYLYRWYGTHWRSFFRTFGASIYNFTGKAHLMGTWVWSKQYSRLMAIKIMLFLQLILQKLSWMTSRLSIHLTW